MAAAKGSVNKGDLIYLDYEGYLADGKLFDTTVADAAKTAGIFDEKYEYIPMPIIVGSGKLFPAFEAAIEKAAIGKKDKVDISAEDGAGIRDPKLVEMFPLKEFYKQEINPYPGLEVQLGNRRGTIMQVGAGRVRVDFNNPLAGKDLVYKFTVKEVITDKTEMAKAVVKMSIGTDEGFSFVVSADKVTVTLPELTKFDQNWPVARFRIVPDLRKVLGVNTVEFIEVWTQEKKEEKKKPAAKKAATDAPAKPKEKTETAKKPAAKKAPAKKKE